MGSVSVQSQASSRGERLSAFVDGESFDGSGDISQFLSGFTQKDRAAWSDYHLIGDTLRSESKVIEKRESKSRPDAGIVVFEHRAFNQRDEEVASCRRAALMLKRPQA